MPRIPAPACARYHQEMRAAVSAATPAKRWAHLERAHILSQSDP